MRASGIFGYAFVAIIGVATAADLSRITNSNGVLKTVTGATFQFHSFNAPALTSATTSFEVDDTLAIFANFTNPVTRLMVLAGENLMSTCNQYNEYELQRWDYIIAKANALGVRLIIPLINGKQNTYYGTYTWYGQLCQNNATDAGFYVASRSQFLSFVTMALKRNNTVNGLRWGDDPAVFAIETGNELGSWSDAPPPADWTLAVAAQVKQLAPKVLFVDGTLIGGVRTRWPTSVLQSSNVDIFSDHFYRMCSPDVTCLKDSAAFVKNYGKAFIAGEWGFDLTTLDQFFAAANSSGTAGTLVWSMRAHNYQGGFTTHTEDGGPSSWHLPGWNRTQFAWTSNEGTVIAQNFIKPMANGIFPAPTKPPGFITTAGGKLKWQGSAWADRYEIIRTTNNIDTTITTHAYDAFDCSKSSFFNDTSATSNSTYRIRGVGKSGGYTAWSSLILKPNGNSCTDSSECYESCCSSGKCSGGFFKCAKKDFGPRATTQATTTKTATTSPTATLLADWNFCTTSASCQSRCCSTQYSDDGKYKCTPNGTQCK